MYNIIYNTILIQHLILIDTTNNNSIKESQAFYYKVFETALFYIALSDNKHSSGFKVSISKSSLISSKWHMAIFD